MRIQEILSSAIIAYKAGRVFVSLFLFLFLMSCQPTPPDALSESKKDFFFFTGTAQDVNARICQKMAEVRAVKAIVTAAAEKSGRVELSSNMEQTVIGGAITQNVKTEQKGKKFFCTVRVKISEDDFSYAVSRIKIK